MGKCRWLKRRYRRKSLKMETAAPQLVAASAAQGEPLPAAIAATTARWERLSRATGRNFGADGRDDQGEVDRQGRLHASCQATTMGLLRDKADPRGDRVPCALATRAQRSSIWQSRAIPRSGSAGRAGYRPAHSTLMQSRKAPLQPNPTYKNAWS
jgi:hypothetical protein